MTQTQDDKNEENDEIVPPGTPDRTPVEDPDTKKKPVSDPQPPEKKRPRL